jgi:N-methylhydantoinase A
MADLVRRATIMRGHDPSEFVLYAYGGAAPQYVGRYGREIGVQAAYVPGLAAVFSAFGAVSSDFRAVVTQDFPARELLTSVDAVNAALTETFAQSSRELAGIGDDLVVHQRAGLRFFRQVHELQVQLPDGPLDDDTAKDVVDRFHAEYEKIVGEGTVAAEARVEVVNVTTEVVLHLGADTALTQHRAGDMNPTGERLAWFGGEERRCPVYDAALLPVGVDIEGPAFVEVPTTTLVVYPGQRATLDASGHIRLDFGQSQ